MWLPARHGPQRPLRLLPVALARLCAVGVVLALVPACSEDEGADLEPAEPGITAAAATTTLTPPPEPPERGVLYALHAVSAEVARDDSGYLLTLEGAERRTQWVTDRDGGSVSTGGLVDGWEDLGLDATPPDAALLPAQPGSGGVRLVLFEPRWDEQARRLTYRVELAESADSRLQGLVPDQPRDPVGPYGAATLWMHTTTTETPAEETPTTTSTPSTTEPAPTSTTAPSSVPSSTTSSSAPTTPSTTPTLPSTLPTLPPPTPPPTSGPGGEPAIVASATKVRIPTTGGVGTVVLRNTGSGVGSWSAVPPRDVGISVSPSSGLLFPGSSTTVRITYDGVGGPANQFAEDFDTELRISTSQGPIVVVIEVAGD